MANLISGRIIVVDDELDIREYMKMLLQEYHYEVFAAASGEEALAYFEKYDLEVLISDIRMPGMNGFELIQNVKRLSENVQCIAITGHGDMDSAVMALRLGAIGYLQKPLDFAELEVTVSLALEKYRLVRQVQSQQQQLEQLVEEQAEALKEVNERLRREIARRRELEVKLKINGSPQLL